MNTEHTDFALNPPVLFLRDWEEDQPSIVIQICKLRFQDGKQATARIQAASPYQDCTVEYAGEFERLPLRYETADSVLLRVLFQSFARELRAKFEEELIGTWASDREEEEAEGPRAGAF